MNIVIGASGKMIVLCLNIDGASEPGLLDRIAFQIPNKEFPVDSMTVDDKFLARLSRGGLVSQDEFDQLSRDLPPENLAGALAKRFISTVEARVLVYAARLYARAGLEYEVLELCSRSPRLQELQKLVQKTLPRIRKDYPDIKMVGKLMDEAFLVIDLETGKIVRFPPILPAG